MQKTTSLEDWIERYLDACTVEGKSPKTLIAYRESLNIYLRLCHEHDLTTCVTDVSVPDVYRFLAAVRAPGPSVHTQHRRHREVKHFFSWLKRMKVRPDNPFQEVPLIRLPETIVQPFESRDIEALLGALDQDTPLGIRDAAIILFLLDTGVRASELTSLDLCDLSLDLQRARILKGKGGKQRVIAFGPDVVSALERYLDVRGDVAGALFQTRQGNRMRPNGLIVLFQRLGSKAGVRNVHPHRFRHTFATVAIRSAAREIDVQHLLGHSTSAMVRRYTKTYDSELAAEAHGSFSPVAGLLGRPGHALAGSR